jgi:hypothetical protein
MLGKLIFAAAMLAVLPSKRASAQQQYYDSIATATYSVASVSTYTYTQVDRLDKGSTANTGFSGNVLYLDIPKSGAINCGFDVYVSTQPTSNSYGAELSAPSTNSIIYRIVLGALHYYCMAQSTSAAQKISVWETSPFRTPRVIPGSP